MNGFMYRIITALVRIFLDIADYFNKINHKWYIRYKQEMKNEIIRLKQMGDLNEYK